MKKLPLSFYLRNDVVKISKELIGKVLVTNWHNKLTSGRIVETEAYEGEIDRASHASKGRTPRTQVLFGEGGKAYVYLCYGIHEMFNIVTNDEGIPHAPDPPPLQSPTFTSSSSQTLLSSHTSSYGYPSRHWAEEVFVGLGERGAPRSVFRGAYQLWVCIELRGCPSMKLTKA